jgi:hypothetical protein
MRKILYVWTLAVAILIGFTIAIGSSINQGFISVGALAASAYATIEQAGSALTQRTTLNFSGSGVTCTDDSADARTNCVVSGGGGGGVTGAFPVQALSARSPNTLTLPKASIAGNVFAVGLDWFGGAATSPTLTDSAGTSYTLVVQHTGDSADNCALFVGTVPASPGIVSFSPVYPASADQPGDDVIELANATTTVDVSVASTAGNVNAPISMTLTTTGDTIIAVAGDPSSGGIITFPFGMTGAWISGNDTGGIAMTNAGVLGTLPAEVFTIGGSANTPAFSTIGFTACYAMMALEHP